MAFQILIYALCFIAVMAFFALAMTQRRLAVAIFCGLLPAYLLRFTVPIPHLPIPSTMLEVFWAILMLSWLLSSPTPTLKRLNIDKRWVLPITLFVTAATLSCIVPFHIAPAIGLWRAYIIEPILFFVMFVDTMKTSHDRAAAIYGLASSLVVVGIIAVYQKITGAFIPNIHWQPAATRRITAFYGFPNAVALFAAPTTLLSLAMFGHTHAEKRSEQIFAYCFASITAILGILATLFAVSKGGLGGIAVGLIVFGLFFKRLRVAALVAVIAACALFLFAPFASRFATNITTANDPSSSVRRIVWSESLAMLRDNVVFGAGMSGYPTALVPYHLATYIEIFQYPHNIILNFWSEMGLMGVVAFIWLVAVYFMIAAPLVGHTTTKFLGAALIAAMLAILVHGMVDVPYFKNDLAMLFWLMAGLAESARQHSIAGVDEKKKA